MCNVRPPGRELMFCGAFPSLMCVASLLFVATTASVVAQPCDALCSLRARAPMDTVRHHTHTHSSLFPGGRGRMIVSGKPRVYDQDACSATHPRFFIACLAHLVLHHAYMHMMKEYTLERFFNCRRKGGAPHSEQSQPRHRTRVLLCGIKCRTRTGLARSDNHLAQLVQ